MRKGHRCQECGIVLEWSEVQRVYDEFGVEHRLCIDCAEEKYLSRDPLPACFGLQQTPK